MIVVNTGPSSAPARNRACNCESVPDGENTTSTLVSDSPRQAFNSSRIASAAEQAVQRPEQFGHGGGRAGPIPSDRILGRIQPKRGVQRRHDFTRRLLLLWMQVLQTA